MAGQRDASHGINRIIPIARPIGHPADSAAIGHSHGHPVPAARFQMTEGGGFCNSRDFLDQHGLCWGRESSQERSAFLQPFLRGGKRMFIEKTRHGVCTACTYGFLYNFLWRNGFAFSPE